MTEKVTTPYYASPQVHEGSPLGESLGLLVRAQGIQKLWMPGRAAWRKGLALEEDV